MNMEEKEVIETQDAVEEAVVVNENPSEIDSLNAKIAELNDKYLRMAAELENTRRRAALDAESTTRNRIMSIAQNFLPLMDAISAALSHEPNDEGIVSIAKTLESTLAKIGIIKIETICQPLNPQFHNALQVVDVPPEDCPCGAKTFPNMIVGELQSGYMFGDMVLRPAMVVVSK